MDLERRDARIRRLGADDIPTMRAMNAMMGEAFDQRDVHDAAPPDDGYLRALLGDDRFIALAATCDGDVVGGLVAYELRKYEQARSEVYIYDLAVDAAHRRRGIATALIDALRPIARACGAWVVYVQADPDDGPAMALYAKLGTREDVCHFDIGVD